MIFLRDLLRRGLRPWEYEERRVERHVGYLHRPNPALHPHEPLHHFPVFVRVKGIGYPVVDVVFLRQV